MPLEKDTMYGGRTISLRYQKMRRNKKITTIKTKNKRKQKTNTVDGVAAVTVIVVDLVSTLVVVLLLLSP